MGCYFGERVVVTGGAGSIGGRVALDLCDAGAKVVVVDNLSGGHSANIPPEAEFVLGDVADAHLMHEVFARHRPSFVFHLAAHFAHANSVEHPLADLRSNGLGTLVALESAAKHHVRRFVYASSSCVLMATDTPLTEDAAAGSCETPYSISKFTGEMYARFFAHFHRLPVTVLRYFNSYGPGDYPGSYRSVIPNLLWLAMQGRPLEITGTGAETRDFTYVSDASRATLLAGEKGSSPYEVYHIGSGESVSITALGRLINEVTGNPAGLAYGRRRHWDRTPHRHADISLAASQLGYRPRVPLEQGIRLTYEWLTRQGSLTPAEAGE